MVSDHWNPPRVAVVLLHNGKLRLSKNVTEQVWRFPEDAMVVRDKDVMTSAKRIMLEHFGVTFMTEGILAVRVNEGAEHVCSLVTYVLGRVMDDQTDPKPGLQLNTVSLHRMKELRDDHKLAYDVIPLYDQAQAWINKEKS